MTYDYRRTYTPPPPPPPPPPPRVVKSADAVDAGEGPRTVNAAVGAEGQPPARRVEATPEMQAASRPGLQSAPGGADDPARKPLTPAQRQEVDRSVRRFENAVDLAQAMPPGDAKNHAVLEATGRLNDVLADKTPAQTRAILKGTQGSVEDLTRELGPLDGDATVQAVENLTAATEKAGRADAHLITDPVARGLPTALDEHENNLGEVLSGMTSSIAEGHGALFGASLTRSIADTGDVRLANTVGLHQATALEHVRDDFDEKTKKADELDARLAHTIERWKGVLSPSEIQAGIDRYKEEHADVYDARDEAAKVFGSTMEGAALGADEAARPFAGLVVEDELRQNGVSQLRRVPALSRSDVGAGMIADAAEVEGRGRPTYLRDAHKLAAGPEGDTENFRDDLTSSVMRSVAVRGEQHMKDGELDHAANVLEGVSRATADPDLRQAYGRLARKVDDLSMAEDLTAAKRATSISSSVNKIASSTLDDAAAERFKLLGPALGIGALAANGANFVQDPSLRHAADTIASAAGPAGAAWETFGKESFEAKGAASLLSKTGVVTTYAFSALDTFNALERGDEVGAAAAAAPAIGATVGGIAGAGVFSIPGALLGGAIGSVVGVGIKVVQGVVEDSPEEVHEKTVDPFLRGAFAEAGIDEEAAYRLRDVDGDFEGVGPIFGPVAEKLGMTPREVLQRFSALSDDDRIDFAKEAQDVDTNSDDRQEASENGEAPPALVFDDGDLQSFTDNWRERLGA